MSSEGVNSLRKDLVRLLIDHGADVRLARFAELRLDSESCSLKVAALFLFEFLPISGETPLVEKIHRVLIKDTAGIGLPPPAKEND
jgi:hypothetical protein